MRGSRCILILLALFIALGLLGFRWITSTTRPLEHADRLFIHSNNLQDKNKNHTTFDIQIVYNAFINDKRDNWMVLIANQLKSLKSTGLAGAATQVYVCLSTHGANETNMHVASQVSMAAKMIRSIIPSARIEATIANEFEYPGISRVWKIGQQTDAHVANDTVVLYFHSKGMFNGPEKDTTVVPMERLLFHTVIKNWRDILIRFQDRRLNKAGFAAAKSGCMWYNFWWARISYIQNLVPPIKTSQRYYYEDWLSRIDPLFLWPKLWSLNFETKEERGIASGHSDCLSLLKPNLPIGVYFSPDAVIRETRLMLDKYKNCWLCS